jgi:CHASE2 domain-containing sensor protein
LVATENAEYGFRRNTLGLKPIAILVAIGIGVLSLVLAAIDSWPPGFVVPAVVSVLALVFWVWVVTPDWVRSAAETYAARLMEAVETLAAGRSRKPRPQR